MQSSELIKFFHDIGQLKNISRTGWGRCGIKKPESVADHSFRTALIAMVMSDYLKFNTEKVMRLALLHDLAEVVTGDITPYDKLTTQEKREKELMAVEEILEGLTNAKDYLTLWKEYDNGASQEAKLVKNIDKFEMALQAAEYQKQFPKLDLSEFVIDAEKQINLNELRELFQIIEK